jgi:phosphatidylserine synthase 2
MPMGSATHRNCKLENKLDQYSGVFASVIGFLAFASVQFPDTLIKRPHPIFWRVLLGCFIIYTLFMSYVLFQPLGEARKIFKFFDPALG